MDQRQEIAMPKGDRIVAGNEPKHQHEPNQPNDAMKVAGRYAQSQQNALLKVRLNV